MVEKLMYCAFSDAYGAANNVLKSIIGDQNHLFNKIFIVMPALTYLAICNIFLYLRPTSVKARGASKIYVEAEKYPLNLTPVNTGVGKPPTFPCALFCCFGDKHERCH